MFKKDLEKDVAGDTSGDVAKLLLALVQVKIIFCTILICNSTIIQLYCILYNSTIIQLLPMQTQHYFFLHIFTLLQIYNHRSYSVYRAKEMCRVMWWTMRRLTVMQE